MKKEIFWKKAKMKIKRFSLWMLLCVVFALGGCGYNTMQQAEERVFKAWGDVDASHERETPKTGPDFVGGFWHDLWPKSGRSA